MARRKPSPSATSVSTTTTASIDGVTDFVPWHDFGAPDLAAGAANACVDVLIMPRGDSERWAWARALVLAHATRVIAAMPQWLTVPTDAPVDALLVRAVATRTLRALLDPYPELQAEAAAVAWHRATPRRDGAASDTAALRFDDGTRVTVNLALAVAIAGVRRSAPRARPAGDERAQDAAPRREDAGLRFPVNVRLRRRASSTRSSAHRIWLLDHARLDRLREIVRAMPAHALAGFDLASLVPTSQSAPSATPHIALLRYSGEDSPGMFLELRPVYVPLSGAETVWLPEGFALVPAVRPARVATLLGLDDRPGWGADRDRDTLDVAATTAILVPRGPQSANLDALPFGADVAFDLIGARVREAAPLADFLAYELHVDLLPTDAVPAPALLPLDVLRAPRELAVQIREGLLTIPRPTTSRGTERRHSLTAAGPHPVVAAAASVEQEQPEPERAVAPSGAPAAPAEHATDVKPLHDAALLIAAEVALEQRLAQRLTDPIATDKPLEPTVQARLEAQPLIDGEPAEAELLRTWLALADVKRERGLPADAWWCWLHAAWLTRWAGARDPVVTVLRELQSRLASTRWADTSMRARGADADASATAAPDVERADADALPAEAEAIAPDDPSFTTTEADASGPDGDWLERADAWLDRLEVSPRFAPQSVARLLAYTTHLRATGASATPTRVVRVARLFQRMRARMPMMARWHCAVDLAALTADEVMLEREREALLGELNTRGLSPADVAPFLARLLTGPGVRAADGPAELNAGGAATIAPADTVTPGVPPTRRLESDIAMLWMRQARQIGVQHKDVGMIEPAFFLGVAEELVLLSPEYTRTVLPAGIAKSWASRTATRGGLALRDLLNAHASELAGRSAPAELEQERVSAFARVWDLMLTPQQGKPSSLREMSEELRDRFSRYLALASLRWASSAVREFWRERIAADLGIGLQLMNRQPSLWMLLLGVRFVGERVLAELEQFADDKGALPMAAGTVAQVVTILETLAGVRVDASGRTPSAAARTLTDGLPGDAPLSIVERNELANRAQACFERLRARVPWEREVEVLGPVLDGLAHLDANAEACGVTWRAPMNSRDHQWLRVRGPFWCAQIAHAARRASLTGDAELRERAAAMLTRLNEAWVRTFGREKLFGKDAGVVSPAVRTVLRWFVRRVLEVTPLLGNPQLGHEVVDLALRECPTDAYSVTEVTGMAARALALLGDRVGASRLLERILELAAAQVGAEAGAGGSQGVYTLVKDLIPAALHLLPIEQARTFILNRVAALLPTHFRDTGGAYFGPATRVMLDFAEAQLLAGPGHAPHLAKPAKRDTALFIIGAISREREAAAASFARARNNDPADPTTPADRRDLAILWSKLFLQARGYEGAGSLMPYFTEPDQFCRVGSQDQTGMGHLAHEQLRLLADHFLSQAGTERQALVEYRAREEARLRDRIAAEMP